MQEKRCSRCGASFGCGRDDPRCWCIELPPLAGDALDATRDCLCPACLKRALDGAAGDDDGDAPDPRPAA